MSTTDFQAYYFSDGFYQLELNLQNIRRYLIFLLEEAEDMECFKCSRLRCRCVPSITPRTSSMSDLGSFSDLDSSSLASSDLDYIFITAPPAETLPLPVWPCAPSPRSSPDVEEYQDILKWVMSANPNADGNDLQFYIDENINSEVNCSWPPSPSSIWCESPTSPPPGEGPSDSVEAFFKCFAEASHNRGYSYF